MLGALVSLGAMASLAQADEHVVKMLNMSSQPSVEYMVFEPDFVKAKVGDTVRFVAADRNHNAEAIDETWPDGVEQIEGKLNQEIVLTVTNDGVCGVKRLPHDAMGMIAKAVAGSPDLEKIKAMKFSGRMERRMQNMIAKASQ